MRKTSPVFHFLIPLFYIGTIFFLMVFQFSKNESFSQSLGDLIISGKSSSSAQGQEVLDLQIRSSCLKFFFSAKQSIVILTEDGVTHTVRPISWSQRKNGIEVSFQHQFKLLFEKKGANDSALRIHPVLSPSLEKATRISIPFSAEQGFVFRLHNYVPLIEAVKGKNHFMVALDGGPDYISEDHVFHLNVRSGQTQAISLKLLQDGEDPINAWLGRSVHQDLKLAIKNFLNKAYAAWQTERFQPELGVWDLGEGTRAYYEPLVSAYLREALYRKDYQKAFAQVFPGSRQYASEWGFEAMPYVGNLVRTTVAKRQHFEVLASQDHIDWIDRLWSDSRYYAPEAYILRLEKALLTGEIPKRIPYRLAFFSNLLALKEEQPQREGVNNRIQQLLTLCLERLLRHENHLYFVHDNGWLDLRSTLILGALLLKHAKMNKEPILSSLGSRLLLSALAQQDKKGFIPEILVLDKGKISHKEGLLRPEDFYSLLADDPVQEIPLDVQSWPKKSFIRTPAVLVAHEISPESAKFVFQFPSSAAQHLVIQGVPPFDHLLLHDIRWRTDHEFQIYSDGWYYHDLTQTLYVKIKHRVEKEELIIRFQP